MINWIEFKNIVLRFVSRFFDFLSNKNSHPITTIVLMIFTFILAKVLMAFFYSSGSGSPTFSEAFKNVSELPAFISAVLSIFIGAISFYNHLSLKTKKLFTDKLQEILGKAEIVLKIDLIKLEPDDIAVNQECFSKLNESAASGPIKLYALDNTPATQWWSESMLGYLAIQAQWAAGVEGREIHRFFVYDTDADALSTQWVKIINIHILFGFNTYIMSKKSYNYLLKSFKDAAKLDSKIKMEKEFVVWDRAGNVTIQITRYTKIHNTLRGSDVSGYQSFWSIHDTYLQRINGPFKDIEGRDVEKDKLDILYEFITGNHVQTADAFAKFAKYLISTADCCDDKNFRVPTKLGKKMHHIIHIPQYRKNKGEKNKVVKCDEKPIPLTMDMVENIITSYVKQNN